MIPRTTYTIGIRDYVEGVKDAHGNTTSGWGNTRNVEVWGIAPRFSNETYETGRNPVITGYTIIAPPDLVIDRRSLVIWDGVEYEVEGEVGDWTTGPFAYRPGVTINIKRVGG